MKKLLVGSFIYEYTHYVFMASVNISIKNEAYKFLKSLKSREKSFSDVILELRDSRKYERGSKEAVLRFAGVLKDKGIDWEAKGKKMKQFRMEVEKRFENTRRKMKEVRKS